MFGILNTIAQYYPIFGKTPTVQMKVNTSKIKAKIPAFHRKHELQSMLNVYPLHPIKSNIPEKKKTGIEFLDSS